jgi:hypothetical protein
MTAAQHQAVAPRQSDHEPETWGELGPAMKALPNEKWRDFVRYLVRDPAHGGITRSYVKAGFGKNSRPTAPRSNLNKCAFKLCADVRIINAIAEESRKVLRIGHPEAINALFAMIRDPKHKDHARAVAMVIDRVDPVETRQSISVTHRHLDADEEELEELRAARALGASREMLVSLFGGNRLPRLERLDLERRSDKAKVIDAEVTQEIPDGR